MNQLLRSACADDFRQMSLIGTQSRNGFVDLVSIVGVPSGKHRQQHLLEFTVTIFLDVRDQIALNFSSVHLNQLLQFFVAKRDHNFHNFSVIRHKAAQGLANILGCCTQAHFLFRRHAIG